MFDRIKTMASGTYKYWFTNVVDTSPAKTLDRVDLFKLLRNGGIYTLGTGLTVLLEQVTGANYGVLTPIVVAIVAGLIDAVRKLLKDNGVDVSK